SEPVSTRGPARHENLHVRVGPFDRVDIAQLRGEGVAVFDLAGTERGGACCTVWHDLEDEAIEVDFALPVIGVLVERYELLRLGILQDHGPSSNDLLVNGAAIDQLL